MNIGKGDLAPNLVITCTSSSGVVDLTAATTVQVVCRKEGATTPFFTRAATGTAQGVATYTWQAGDTDTVGRLLFQVKVTWPGPKVEHFPATGYLPVDVLDTLD